MTKEGDKANAATRLPPSLPPRFVVGTFLNSSSQSLFTINLPPKNASSPPRAMLVLSHGLCGHCCRPGYLGLYESLSDAGVEVCALDHRGHGRSDGLPRGYVEKFDDYVVDLLAYIRQCQGKYNDNGDTSCPPLILMGHSMGGLISVMAALSLGSDQVGGIILTSPALGVDLNPMLKVQKFFGPMINKLLPKARIVDAIRPKELFRNPRSLREYIEDPLVQKGKVVARTAYCMSETMEIVKERRGEILCPILMLHGTNDRTTSPNSSLDFFRNVGSSRKRYLQLPLFRHEVFEGGPETDVLVSSIVKFASAGGCEFADVDGKEKEDDGLVVVEFRSVAPV